MSLTWEPNSINDAIALSKLERENYQIVSKLLNCSPVFNGLTVEMLINWLKRKLIRVKNYSENQIIIQENDEDCTSFYVLLDGIVDIYKWDNIVASLDPISIFGEMWYLDETTWRTATVKARNKVVVFCVTQAFVDTLKSSTQAKLIRTLWAQACSKLKNMNTVVANWSKASALIDAAAKELSGTIVMSWVPVWW